MVVIKTNLGKWESGCDYKSGTLHEFEKISNQIIAELILLAVVYQSCSFLRFLQIFYNF